MTSAKSWTLRRSKEVQAFLWVATAVAGCVLAFGLFFPTASLAAINAWSQTSAFNHCFLILPLSLFLIWERRREISEGDTQPDFRAGLAMLAASMVWLFCYFADVVEAQQFVIVTMIQVALFGLFGRRLYAKLSGPLLYLYFLIPTGLYLIPWLQMFTARFAIAGLHLFRIPVYSTGTLIEIPAGSFSVAEACAGLRFLIASLAFGVFFALFVYRSALRRTLFIALSLILPIVANGIRVFGLIAAAEWVGSATVVMVDHVLYGWAFFSIVLIAQIGMGLLFQDRWQADAPVSGPAVRPPGRNRFLAAAASCLIGASVGPALASISREPETTALPTAPPAIAAPWHIVSGSINWWPATTAPDRVFHDSMRNGDKSVDRFVALYGTKGSFRNVARLQNRDANGDYWTFASMHFETVRAHELAVPVRASTWIHGDQRREVWSFLVVNGYVASNVWAAKWYQFLEHFDRVSCPSAYVAFSAIDSDLVPGRAALQAALNASEPMTAYLCRTPAVR
ncbi:MAG TPA: exosortase A [Rhizomicrobium sp.]|nr:exosortase A [Rhizomicrobium sp.]